MVSVLEAIVPRLDGIMPPTPAHNQEVVGGQTPTTLTPKQQVTSGFQSPPPSLPPSSSEVVAQHVGHLGGATLTTSRKADATNELRAFLSFGPPDFDATPTSVGP